MGKGITNQLAATYHIDGICNAIARKVGKVLGETEVLIDRIMWPRQDSEEPEVHYIIARVGEIVHANYTAVIDADHELPWVLTKLESVDPAEIVYEKIDAYSRGEAPRLF